MSYYSIQADFENIDSPELIAAALSILENEGWSIKDYTDVFIQAEKLTVANQIADLQVSVARNEVTIACNSELVEEANQFIVDSFVQRLYQFVSSQHFDRAVRELKNHYFMNNPLHESDESSATGPDESSFKTFFSFRKYFRVTPAIIILNFAVLLAMVVSGISIMLPDPESVLAWGGVNRSLVLAGGWWRLLASTFLHYGIIHIAFNMWALYSIGMFLERMIGSWRFAFAYLISGLAGGLNSIVWHAYGAGAGASGAIFGMFGLFLALLTTNILEKGFRTAMLRSVVPMILFNLLIGTAGQIDNAAHLGGLLSGLACGYLYAWHFKNPRNQLINIISFIIPVFIILVSGFAIGKNLPDPYTDYEIIMKKISNLEKQALVLEKTSPASDSGIRLWDSAIKEINKARQLDLHKDMDLRNERLLFYLQKRKESAVLSSDYPGLVELRKKKLQSVDSILKILNSKEEP